MNLPNKLSILRICLIPVFVALYYLTMIPYNYVLSGVVFVLAASTDFLDGYIARKYNLVTNLGKFLDPIADKVLVSTALIVMCANPTVLEYNLTCAFAICVAIILGRELIVSGFRIVAASTGLVLAADKIGKFKTVFQDLAIIVLLVCFDLSGSINKITFIVGISMIGIATLLTIVSGINYVVKNKAVLKENK